MHTCECLAGSQHRHANDDIGLHGAHGRVRLAETGVGIRGNKPHLKHALERRQYPLCGREILSVYPPTDYTRQQRSAYGHTHADRPSASKKCGRVPGKLEAARRAAKRKPRRPICTPPASACVRARHPTRARICVRVVAFATPGRREPDAARWTQRAGSHPGRDMCGITLRGACAPDIRRGTEFTHWPRSAASTNKNQNKTNKHSVPRARGSSQSRSRLSGPEKWEAACRGAESGAAARG